MLDPDFTALLRGLYFLPKLLHELLPSSVDNLKPCYFIFWPLCCIKILFVPAVCFFQSISVSMVSVIAFIEDILSLLGDVDMDSTFSNSIAYSDVQIIP